MYFRIEIFEVSEIYHARANKDIWPGIRQRAGKR